jgi:hypothetical protein
MGKLAERKTKLTFETEAALRSWGTVQKKKKPVMRSVMVEIENGWHGKVRLKGTRHAYQFSFEGLYLWAVNQQVLRDRAEKKKQREAKKKKH